MNNEHLKMPELPWKQGYEAGLNGLLNACPYPPVSDASWAWSSGYVEGRADSKTPKTEGVDDAKSTD